MQKLNRLKKQGVDLRGTEYNPDVSSLDDIRGMSVKQLRDYVQRMKVFTSRNAQFHSAINGDIISKTDMDILRGRQRALNARMARQRKQFAKFVDPSTGMSIKQRMIERAAVSGGRSFEGLSGVDSGPLASKNRRVRQYASKRAFEEHLDRLKFLSSREGGKYQFERAWNSFTSMASTLGAEGEKMIADMEAKMRQKGKGRSAFMVLWRDSSLAENMRNAYRLSKLDFSQVHMGESNPNLGRSGGRTKNVFKAISQTIAAI